MKELIDLDTAYLATYYFIQELDAAVASEELKVWLGAMQPQVRDGKPMDLAIEEYWSAALEKAKRKRNT